MIWTFRIGPFSAEFASAVMLDGEGSFLNENLAKLGFLRIRYSHFFYQDFAINWKIEQPDPSKLNPHKSCWSACLMNIHNKSPCFSLDLMTGWIQAGNDKDAVAEIVPDILKIVAQNWVFKSTGFMESSLARIAPGMMGQMKDWLEELA